MSKQVIGIDLAGPSNPTHTSLVVFESVEEQLRLRESYDEANDHFIRDVVTRLAERSDVVIGVDAPLSYNDGGGDRPGDAALRERIVAAGLRPGSVMAPTMTRMAYLTLRGIGVARLLCSLDPVPRLVEVHPGAAMALRGAPVDSVIAFKYSEEARLRLLAWLEEQELCNVTALRRGSDHYLAACAAALAAWKWCRNQSVWLHPASPPFHPFDYAC